VTDSKVESLESDVERLKQENTKLNADMRILRDEHTEVLHQLFTMDKRNGALFRENLDLKRLNNRDDEIPTDFKLTQVSDQNNRFLSFDRVHVAAKSVPLSNIASGREGPLTSLKDHKQGATTTESDDIGIQDQSDNRLTHENNTFGQQYKLKTSDSNQHIASMRQEFMPVKVFEKKENRTPTQEK